MPVQNSSGRIVTLMAVSQGQVYYANVGDTVWTLATNNTGRTPPLNFTGIVRSAPNNQKLWIVDGVNFATFSPSAGTVSNWTASAGQLPVDADNNAPTLISLWRGRTLLSGLLDDPQNLFASAVGDPTNWDYNPTFTTPTQAFALNASPLGTVGDVITGLIPYNDDILFLLTDHQLWVINGDPLAGGQLDMISDLIGGCWGTAWCRDPNGNVYWMSNRTGIFAMNIQQKQPVRISQQIEPILQTINVGTNTINLLWNDRFQGIHVFITPTQGPAPATHLFYETRTGAWWQDQFANILYNPLCCALFDGDKPDDRLPLIGSWDGYVRAISPIATDDDGYPISSSVMLGPILTKDMDEVMLKDIQAIMGETSGSVNFQVLVGSTAEEAFSNQPVASGIWNEGRNLLSNIRFSGHAIYIRITSTNQWAMEQIRVRVAALGKVRRRGL